MKKKILFIMFIAASIIFAALLSGCPTNIQPGDYRIYTVNGIVTKSDGETGIENILIEVRNQKILEKNENVVVNFLSADEKLNIVYSYGRSDGDGDQNSSDDGNSSNSSGDNSSSSGDGNSTDNSGDNSGDSSSSSASDSNESSSSSSSSGDENSTDNSGDSSSSSDNNNSSDQSSDTENSSPDENPILNSCRTAADGKFTLTFKSYDSDTNLTFIIYATDDDGNENGGTFKAKSQTITFEKSENDEPANPYGTYKKSSKQYETEIIIRMN